jgi:hypothetical protein
MRKLLDALVREAAPIPGHRATVSSQAPGGREHDNCFPAAITPADGCYPHTEPAADPCFPGPASAPPRLRGHRPTL